MGLLNVEQLKPGMILEKNLLAFNGRFLLFHGGGGMMYRIMLFGIHRAHFVDCFAQQIEHAAERAITKGTGARALRSMMEKIMLDVMYDIPSREDVAEVTINRSVVEGKKPPLLRRKQEKDAA